MRDGLEAACRAVVQRLGAGARPEDVVRADVRSKGLNLEVRSAGGRRWFSWKEGELDELDPFRDRALPGARGWRRRGAAVLAYRPGRRLVLQPEEDSGRVIKLLRPGRARACAQRHRAAEATRSFVTAPLLALDEEQSSITFGRLRGSSLPLDGRAPVRLKAIGRALRRMQDAPLSGELEPFTPQDELGVLATWRTRIERALGGPPAGWDAAHRDVERAARTLPPARTVTVHRDLHDKQFLWTPAGPALLDFDLVAAGDVALDPGNLCAHLSLRALQGTAGCDPESAEAARSGLGSGLGRTEDDFAPRLAFYEATTFLRLALVYALRPRWAGTLEPLVAHARRALGEVVA